MLALCFGGLSCASPTIEAARYSAVVSAITQNDLRELHGRHQLVAGKYARMARYLYDYYRGALAVYRQDFVLGHPIGETRVSGPMVWSVGDAHPENFGLLLGEGNVLAFEANDLDAADRYPYHWDLRRLTVGLVLAARLSRPRLQNEGALVEAAVNAYVETIESWAESPLERTRITGAQMHPILEDLFRRGQRDLAARAELSELTTLEGGRRRFLRGVLDPSEPEAVLADLPDPVRQQVDALIADAYATTLPDFDRTVLDAVREFGSGVASWARVRILVLLSGPTADPADDFIIELKEETQSGASWSLPPDVSANSECDRILRAQPFIWTAPSAEPLWTCRTWLGIPFQLRRESEAQKTFRVDRLEGARSSEAALLALSSSMARRLAEIHAQSLTVALRAEFASDLSAQTNFVSDEAQVATDYADQIERDWNSFRQALSELGPTLGVRLNQSPNPFQRDLYGSPPAVTPWQ